MAAGGSNLIPLFALNMKGLPGQSHGSKKGKSKSMSKVCQPFLLVRRKMRRLRSASNDCWPGTETKLI